MQKLMMSMCSLFIMMAGAVPGAKHTGSWKSIKVNSFGDLKLSVEKDKKQSDKYNIRMVGNLMKAGDFSRILKQMSGEVLSVMRQTRLGGQQNITFYDDILGNRTNLVGSFKVSGNPYEKQMQVKKVRELLEKDLKEGGVSIEYAGHSIWRLEGQPTQVAVNFNILRTSDPYKSWAEEAGVESKDVVSASPAIKIASSPKEMSNTPAKKQIEDILTVKPQPQFTFKTSLK